MGELQDYIKTLISYMMDERFSDITSKADTPFINGGLYISSLIYEAIDAVMADVTLKEDNILGGFEAFYTELERMRRYGFNSDEFDRAKANIISSLETAAEKADTRKNPQFVRPILNNFFDKKPFMDPQTELQIGKQILSMVNVDIINQIAPTLITDENLVIIYSGPKKDGIATPEEARILNVIDKVKAADIQPLKGEEIASEFIDPATLRGSRVKKTGTGPYNSVKWVLGNGVEVYVLPTDHQKDQILLNLSRNGGNSLIKTSDLDSFDNSIWALFLRNSGVAGFSGTQTSKMLTGKNVSVNPFINDLYNGISGNSTKKDLETAFQLMYLQYVTPRFDAEEYAVGINQLKAVLPNLVNTPDFKTQKNFYETLYGGNPRMKLVSEETLEKANIETVRKYYGKLFSDAAGLRLVIVGDVTPEAVQPLVEKYIGSIPAGKKAPKWVDNKVYPVKGIVEKVDPTEMETPKSTVLINYHVTAPYSQVNEAALNAISYIMDMRYTASLREEIGGTYGAHVMGQQQKYPVSSSTLMVQFQCKPELCDTLLTIAKRQIEDFAKNGPTKEEFDMTLLNLKKNIPESRISNGYWLGKIRNSLNGYGEEDKAYEEAVNALTPEQVKAVAASIVLSGNKVEYVNVPSISPGN